MEIVVCNKIIKVMEMIKRVVSGRPKPDPGTPEHPLLVFINPRSGGGQGRQLLRLFREVTDSEHVIDLDEANGPLEALKANMGVEGLRIIAAGGDGTGNWVLSVADQLEQLLPSTVPLPPIGILPLGTANDIARVFGWGGGYTNETVSDLINDYNKAGEVLFDRWRVSEYAIDPSSLLPIGEPKVSVLNNYLSIGFAEAKVALDFHQMRENHPEAFRFRATNKIWYMSYGLRQTIKETLLEAAPNFCDAIDLVIDDVLVEIPREVEGIVVLNIPSYAGGLDLFGPVKESDDRFSFVSFNDAKIEVVGIRGVHHLAEIGLGLSHGVRLGQATSLRITYRPNSPALPAKIDGEPWLQEKACIFEITLMNQRRMLVRNSFINSLASLGADVQLSGYLREVRLINHVRQRFYAISGHWLHCFLNQQSGPPEESFVLPEDPDKISAEDTTVFRIETSKEILTFRTSSTEERDNWVNKLKDIAKSRQ